LAHQDRKTYTSGNSNALTVLAGGGVRLGGIADVGRRLTAADGPAEVAEVSCLVFVRHVVELVMIYNGGYEVYLKKKTQQRWMFWTD
jgi:hypothetical protein